MAVNLGDDDDVQMNMTPLIDTVLVLLTFFLVATTLKKVEKEMPVELPVSGSAVEAPKADPTLVITIDRAGGAHLAGQPVTTEQLHAAVRQAAAADRTRRVRIDGDRLVPFQHIVYVMDLCQFEGLTNLGVHTADKKPAERK